MVEQTSGEQGQLKTFSPMFIFVLDTPLSHRKKKESMGDMMNLQVLVPLSRFDQIAQTKMALKPVPRVISPT